MIKSRFFPLTIVVIMVMLTVSTIPENPLYNINWSLFSAVIIGLAILAMFTRFEKSGTNTKEIVLIATMACLAAISRIPFAAIMSFQPTTFIVMITGYVFGAQTGFIVGAVAALVSNFFLGQGPWTPWQMFCWGMCGVAAGVLAGKSKDFHLIKFAVLGGLCGYLFGWTMNIWHWVCFVYPLDMKTFIATYIASIPFDTLHAVGNILFAVFFGKPFYNILIRFKKKLLVRYANELDD